MALLLLQAGAAAALLPAGAALPRGLLLALLAPLALLLLALLAPLLALLLLQGAQRRTPGLPRARSGCRCAAGRC